MTRKKGCCLSMLGFGTSFRGSSFKPSSKASMVSVHKNNDEVKLIRVGVQKPDSSNQEAETRYKKGSYRELVSQQGILLNGDASNPKSEFKSDNKLLQFTFQELKCATSNFTPNSKLGEGGFGFVFKGWIEGDGTTPAKPGTGIPVAVKILKQDGPQGHKEWVSEVIFLGQLHHPNLVKLIGYCTEDDKRLLVYEYMARGSLENHLFRRSQPLSWSRRVRAALGAANGLAFLHKGVVILRDFKTANILLDQDFNVKLSDFGMAKAGPQGSKTHVSTRVVGTYGYAAPEYVMTGHLTAKSDVYSFGVFLLEILTGRRVIDEQRPAEEQNLVIWARPHLEDTRNFDRLVDPRLQLNFSMKGAQQIAWIASRCIRRNPKSRPSMDEVVKDLIPLEDISDLTNLSLRRHSSQLGLPHV